MKRPRVKHINPHTLQLIRQIVLGVLVLLFIAGLVTGVWYGTRLSAVTITEVSVAGGETIDHARVRGVVQDELSGTYLGLVPRRFAFAYPEADILAQLQRIERLADPTLTRPRWQQLHVEFTEYEPAALWCASATSAECVFVSPDGYAYAGAPNLAGGSLPRYVHLNQPVATSTTLIPAAEFRRLQQFIAELAEQVGWYVSLIQVDQVGDAFMHLTPGSELRVSTDLEPTQTVENIIVLLNSEEFGTLTPGEFQYLDLRFGDKVFVNEEDVIEKSPASSTPATSTPATRSSERSSTTE